MINLSLSLSSPGSVPKSSPSKFIIDLTNLISWYISLWFLSNNNASATLNNVLPVPAGPVHIVTSPLLIDWVNFF